MMILLLIVAPIDVSFTVDFSIATIDMHSAEAKTLTPAKASAEARLLLHHIRSVTFLLRSKTLACTMMYER